MAAAAAKAFLSKEVDMTSQMTYGLQLGLQTLSDMLSECDLQGKEKTTVFVGVLNQSLKCIQLVDQRAVHELAFDNLIEVVNELGECEGKVATDVLQVIMERFSGNVTWKEKFFACVLRVLKPFLASSGDMRDRMLDEISDKVVGFRRFKGERNGAPRFLNSTRAEIINNHMF